MTVKQATPPSSQSTERAHAGVVVTLQELLHLQVPARAMDFKPQKRVGTFLPGGYNSTLRGRGMEFEEVRAYIPGDDIRTMDWRVTARRGIPHTKVYQQERERPVYVIVDFNPSMYFGTRVAFKTVVACRIAALLSWTAVLGNDRIGGILFTGKQQAVFKPRSRQIGILPLLKKMADFSQQAPSELDPHAFSRALLNCRRMTRPGSLVFILSDFQGRDEDTERHLNRLAKHNQVFSILLTDPLEKELPPPDTYAITNGRDHMMIDTSITQLRNQFRRGYLENLEEVQRLCRRAQIPLLETHTNDDVVKRFREYFSKLQGGQHL